MMDRLIISKINELKIVFIGFAFCAFLLIIRLKATHTFFLLFLGWNIILAMVPYGISFILLAHKKWQQKWFAAIPMALLWLLFLPNAPYLITDLQHLRITPAETLWYDIILFASYIAYALSLMILSIKHMESIVNIKTGTYKHYFGILFLFFLCGFGIYLGRYLRWNSWDIMQNPQELLYEIYVRFRHPVQHLSTWMITLSYGILLSLIYMGINQISSASPEPKTTSTEI